MVSSGTWPPSSVKIDTPWARGVAEKPACRLKKNKVFSFSATAFRLLNGSSTSSSRVKMTSICVCSVSRSRMRFAMASVKSLSFILLPAVTPASCPPCPGSSVIVPFTRANEAMSKSSPDGESAGVSSSAISPSSSAADIVSPSGSSSSADSESSRVSASSSRGGRSVSSRIS